MLVHTGQHYDAEMSELFLSQLGMPQPDHRLEVGSGTHGEQTGRVMVALERVLAETPRPTLAFVPGDVNSTLAAALVLAKLEIPYAHIESGLRSFDRAMPEEINRIVADRFATLLLVHSQEAVDNLTAERMNASSIHLVGNTMIDALVLFETRFRSLAAAGALGLAPGGYLLVTLHRPSLVDGDELSVVLGYLDGIAAEMPVVFPMHPRTRQRVDESAYPSIRFLPPLGYLEFLSLESEAAAVLTDSGGVQEETTYLGVPCFTLRTTTERPVTIRLGTNTLLGLAPERIRLIPELVAGRPASRRQPPPLWDGQASDRICDVVSKHLAATDELTP